VSKDHQGSARTPGFQPAKMALPMVRALGFALEGKKTKKQKNTRIFFPKQGKKLIVSWVTTSLGF
jgi:hypothetical protein